MSTYSEKLKDPRWQKKRLEILERDQWTCRGCGDKSKELQVHHTVYENGKKPWEHDSDGLKTLCVDCHGKVTRAVRDFREAISLMPPSESAAIASYMCLAVNHIRSITDDTLTAGTVLKLTTNLHNDIGLIRFAIHTASIEPTEADKIERAVMETSYPF